MWGVRSYEVLEDPPGQVERVHDWGEGLTEEELALGPFRPSSTDKSSLGIQGDLISLGIGEPRDSFTSCLSNKSRV